MRWMAALWVAAALAATASLGVAGAVAGRWPEWAHVVGHVVLCSGLAGMVAQNCASKADGVIVSRRGPAAAAWAGLAGAVAFGLAIEVLQLRVYPVWTELVYDLSVDGLGAALGALAWAHAGRDRVEAVGHVLSAALHPLWIAPAGLAAVAYDLTGSLPSAGALAAGGGLCLAPAIAVWAHGVATARWSDADVSRRADRAPLFLVGCAGMVLFVALAAFGAPVPVARVAAGCAAGAVLGTAVTAAGLKVSGHVAIPAALGLLAAAEGARAAPLLLGVALLLAWARVAASRHQRVEVAAAWVLAGGVAGFAACG